VRDAVDDAAVQFGCRRGRLCRSLRRGLVACEDDRAGGRDRKSYKKQTAALHESYPMKPLGSV
jgi:hypothetical protein